MSTNSGGVGVQGAPKNQSAAPANHWSEFIEASSIGDGLLIPNHWPNFKIPKKLPTARIQTSLNLSLAMASAPHIAVCSLISLSRTPIQKYRNSLPSIRTRKLVKVRASAPDLLGDFGARDPFPAELESNFAENVLGNVDTEHKILIPNAAALSLAERKCVPVSQLQQPLSVDEAKKLLFKVVGWRLVNEGGGLQLQGLWKVRDVKCGEELINRIRKAVESTGHVPALHLDEPNQVRAELWTSSIGGLSINDFIVAAKIDKIKVSDLQPRLRVWA